MKSTFFSRISDKLGAPAEVVYGGLTDHKASNLYKRMRQKFGPGKYIAVAGMRRWYASEGYEILVYKSNEIIEAGLDNINQVASCKRLCDG